MIDRRQKASQEGRNHDGLGRKLRMVVIFNGDECNVDGCRGGIGNKGHLGNDAIETEEIDSYHRQEGSDDQAG